MRTTTLFDGWRGMTPDSPRDKMGKGTVWLMKDYIPDDLGSQLESRAPWVYHVNGPLAGGMVRVQHWVNTLGMSHHLAATAQALYNLDAPASPRSIVGGSGFDNPMASLYEFVGVPKADGQLPVFLKYTVGSGTETVLTTEPSTPPAKFIEAWNSYFVLANYPGFAQRVAWIGPGFSLTGNTTPVFDTKAWWDTSNDVTGLARTRSALLCFHANGVERLRGGIPPGTNRQTDLWMEPLKGLGGCTQPQTINYWNDNVLFCDGRGAYMTDGTQITDLTAMGKISRAWRRRYAATMRIAGGIYGNYWVLSATDTSTGSFVDCWVCDLYSRRWFQFANVSCASFTTAIDTRERLYGGDLAGRVIRADAMWDEADPTVGTVDGNGLAVLPRLETGWYQMTTNFAKKRIREAEIAYDMNEDTGSLRLYFAQQVQPLTSDWILLKTFRMRDQDGIASDTRGLVRRAMQVGYANYGFTFKLETTGTLKNLKLYDLAVEGPISREESYA